jgi:hypothetical protein
MNFIEETKGKISLILSLYPLVVGLYAVGFFWDIPSDIIGSFDLTDFIFKASIVYLKGLAAFSLLIALMAILYSPIIDADVRNQSQDVGSQDRETWESMNSKRKVIFSLCCVAIVALIAFVFYLEPIYFRGLPDKILAFMLVLYIGGMMLRPFLKKDTWNTNKVLLIFSAAMLLPIMIGYNDADVDEKSPVVKVSDQQCPVIFAGSETIIAQCNKDVVVMHRSDDMILRWRK